jgi:Protein of unknown function (DUF2933)
MDWLAENWFWVLIGVVFIVMHLFGHGGHGGHGGHSRHKEHGKKDDHEDEDKKRKSQTPDSGHGHN